jgi:hypothetical protein
MLPRPISAKKLVREGLSKNIVAIGELYGLEVASFEQSRHDLPQVDREERRSRYRDRLLKVFVGVDSGRSLTSRGDLLRSSYTLPTPAWSRGCRARGPNKNTSS